MQIQQYSHQSIPLSGMAVHVVQAGNGKKPPVLFLHGFPECWLEFSAVMQLLKSDYHVIAVDLPGIGDSEPIAVNEKSNIAYCICALIKEMQLTNLTLVGHDVGGMVTYAVLKSNPVQISKAVIMNVVVPGVEPWTKTKQNPMIWHFRFHNIPSLPEILVKRHERVYFDYFFKTIAKHPERITDRDRETYAAA